MNRSEELRNYSDNIIIESLADFDSQIANNTEGTWLIMKSFKLDSNKILPSGVTLEFINSKIDFSNFDITGNNTRIIAKTEQIFNNVGKLNGTWDSHEGSFEWFGAVGDGKTSDSLTLEKALNSSFSRLNGTTGKTYLIDRQIISSPSKDIIINLNGSILTRDSSYSVNEPAILIPKSEHLLKIYNGYINDESESNKKPFIMAMSKKSIEISNLHCQSRGSIFKGYNCNNVIIKENFLMNSDITPSNGSYLCSLTSAKNIAIVGNTIKNTHTGVYVEAIGSGRADAIEVKENKIFKTQDTAIFVRMVGTGGNAFRGAIIRGNILEDIGKAPIKFSAPRKAVSGTMEKCIISDNIIKGMGRNVSSFGIGIFRGSSQNNIKIKECIVSNNIIDGYGTDEAHGSIDDKGMRGIRIDFVHNLVCSDNIIRNTLSDGLYIGRTTNVNGSGNIVDNCCLSSNAEVKAGVYLFGCKVGQFSAISTNNQNGADGINISYTREMRISGNYSNNEGYGINESSDGNEGSKSGLNFYSATLMGNKKAPTIQNGESGIDSSVQINCFDDYGNRHSGDSFRRDKLSSEWAYNRNVGYMFWNTTDNILEIKGVDTNSWFKSKGISENF